MKKNMFLSSYKGISEEELKTLPLDDLARVAHVALEKYFDVSVQGG
jgi:hypothetical protein